MFGRVGRSSQMLMKMKAGGISRTAGAVQPDAGIETCKMMLQSYLWSSPSWTG